MGQQAKFEGEWFSILTDSIHGEYVHSGSEVLIVPPTDDDEVILTSEPSAAFEGETLILPGGETEAGEPHIDTANRELQEEIGYRATELEFLAELRPFSKYLTVRSFVFVARNLKASSMEGDENYTIQKVVVSLADFESLITDGRLHDARVIAALFLARQFLASRS
jgi:ADP-ribose diphosphatase